MIYCVMIKHQVADIYSTRMDNGAINVSTSKVSRNQYAGITQTRELSCALDMPEVRLQR